MKQDKNNSLQSILAAIKKVPAFIKIGFTTTCLPYLGCFILILVIAVLLLSITGGVFEWMDGISDGAATLGETLGNFFDGNGWLTDEEYRDEQERKYYQKLSDAYDKYYTEEFDYIKINTSLITATLFYNKAGGDIQYDENNPACEGNDDDCAVMKTSDEEMGDFYRNARGYVFTLAKYMVVKNEPHTYCTNYCDPNNPYYPGGSLPEACQKGYITTTPGTTRYIPDGSKFISSCANENIINNGELSDSCQSAAARELAEKTWTVGYTTREVYKTYASNQDANGNVTMYPVCPYDNMSSKEREEIETACVNNSLYSTISGLYDSFVDNGCDNDNTTASSTCSSLQSQITQKETSLKGGNKFGSFISIEYNGSNGTSCSFTCPSDFDESSDSTCRQIKEDDYYTVEWKKYQVYYYKIMTQPSMFFGLFKDKSFIEDYYADYVSEDEIKHEESVTEIADGIYDLLYSIIGSEEYYEAYVAGSGPGGYITTYIPGDSGPWQTWTQSGQNWSSIPLGNSSATISTHGCLVTSIAIQIARSGLWPGEFDPGVLVTQLNANGGFVDGNLQWGPLRSVLPPGFTMECDTKAGDCPATLEYMGQVINEGKYVVLRAKIAQHWVAVDYMTESDIYVYDPAVPHSTSLPLSQISSRYDGLNSLRFLVFSASG